MKPKRKRRRPKLSATDDKKSAYEAAIRCLARREYGTKELALFLQHKGFSSEVLTPLIKSLQNDGMLSDERFAQSFIRARIARGFGPLRVAAELRQKGIADSVIERCMGEDDGWRDRIQRVRDKKFGDTPPSTPQEKAKQWRFLQYKGFTSEQINSLFNDL